MILRRLSVCLAFAAWCFASTWVEYAGGKVVYFVRYDPLRTVVAPIAVLGLGLALTLFAGWEFCLRRKLNRVAGLYLLFPAICLAPLGIGSVAVLRLAPASLTAFLTWRWFWPVALLLAAVLLVWICRRPRRASHMVQGVLLYSWPVLILVLLIAARQSLRFPSSAYADGPPAAPAADSRAGTRVVWIVFDELSQTIAFGNRPANLSLPNLDRLRNQSFYATAAVSPSDQTLTSLPSLTLGEQVLDANPTGPRDLELRLASRDGWVSWSALPNVFDDARNLGRNTGLVGWYHPYGRVLDRSLTEFFWVPGFLTAGIAEPLEPQRWWERIWGRVGLQALTIPLVGHLPGSFPEMHANREKAASVEVLMDRACAMVADPSVGLALIHLPVPHPPAIYHRPHGTLPSTPDSYVDSVAQADEELGALRQSLERAGLWDRTAVVVSSDHGWRTTLWRHSPEWTAEDEAVSHQDTSQVPFLVHLPMQESGEVYGKPLHTVLTRQLLDGILSGRVADAGAIADVMR